MSVSLEIEDDEEQGEKKDNKAGEKAGELVTTSLNTVMGITYKKNN